MNGRKMEWLYTEGDTEVSHIGYCIVGVKVLCINEWYKGELDQHSFSVSQ